MKRAAARVVKLFEGVLAAMLAGMLAMVLVNVVMRYGFGSGISATEELSRTLLVWLTFTGAVLAAYEGTHIGVETLIEHLPPGGRVACAIIAEASVVACCALVFYGTWRQHEVNATNKSLTTGMAMIWVYGIGYVASIGIGLVSLWRLWLLTFGASRGDATEAPIAHAAPETLKREAAL